MAAQLLQAKPFAAVGAQRAQRRATVVAAAQQRDAPLAGVKLAAAAAALSAAALLGVSSPAEAGVILVQPEVKKVFIDDGKPAAEKKAAAPAAKKAPAASYQSEGGFDFKLATLPLSLAAVVGGGFALTKVDPGFSRVLAEGSLRDSNLYAGYEPVLKDTPFFGGNGSIPSKVAAPAKKAGTVAKKAGTTSTKKAGTTTTKPATKKGSIFGKK